MASTSISIDERRTRRLPRRSTLPTILTVAMAIVSSVTLLLLVQTSGVTITGYDVKRLEQERDDWQQANYQIEAQIARLESLDRIDKDARGKLKMVPPTDYMYVTVQTVPAPATSEIIPLSHPKKTDSVHDDEGWSQQVLDWLGAVLGFRQR